MHDYRITRLNVHLDCDWLAHWQQSFLLFCSPQSRSIWLLLCLCACVYNVLKREGKNVILRSLSIYLLGSHYYRINMSSVGLMPTNNELLNSAAAVWKGPSSLSAVTADSVWHSQLGYVSFFRVHHHFFTFSLFLLYISSFFHCLCFAFRNLLLCFGALLCLPAQFDFRSEIIGIEIGFVWAAATATTAAAAYFALCTLFCCLSQSKLSLAPLWTRLEFNLKMLLPLLSEEKFVAGRSVKNGSWKTQSEEWSAKQRERDFVTAAAAAKSGGELGSQRGWSKAAQWTESVSSVNGHHCIFA